MDKIKFFNQQLNGQIVMSELEAEHLADSIRLLSAGEDPTTWAEEVAVHAATLAQVTAWAKNIKAQGFDPAVHA